MALSKMKEVLESRQTLLEEWVKAQLDSGVLRQDLISEAEMRQDSSALLNLLWEAGLKDDAFDIRRAAYKPVLGFLEELSRSRGRKGFSPAETAIFILSLKRPLFSALKKAHGSDASTLADGIWEATEFLDNLALHTFDTYLVAREEVIQGQQADMLELSTPVVQLWEGIVALPLIGTLDSHRTSIVMETLLQEIVKTRSEIAILDITGVSTVDTQVAQHLLKTVAAARLMGPKRIEECKMPIGVVGLRSADQIFPAGRGLGGSKAGKRLPSPDFQPITIEMLTTSFPASFPAETAVPGYYGTAKTDRIAGEDTDAAQRRRRFTGRREEPPGA